MVPQVRLKHNVMREMIETLFKNKVPIEKRPDNIFWHAGTSQFSTMAGMHDAHALMLHRLAVVPSPARAPLCADPCSGNTCSNHGTCGGNNVCACTGGWTGDRCQTSAATPPLRAAAAPDPVALVTHHSPLGLRLIFHMILVRLQFQTRIKSR